MHPVPRCFLLLVCFLAVLAVARQSSASDIGSFMLVTDIHVDSEYEAGSDALSRCVNVTDNQTNVAQPWGNYLCGALTCSLSLF
jgi:hypothetical protein